MRTVPSLIGLPYDGGSSFLRGPAAAPPLIREALHSPAGNLWTEDLRDLGAPGTLSDAGDLALPDTSDVRRRIEAGIADLLAAGASPIALGGDHSVTYPIVRGIAQARGPVTILHVDAHPDLYPEFEGDRYSHACPFARILEEGLASRLVQVGIRAMTGAQRDLADRHGVEVIDISIDLDGLDPAFAPGVAHWEPGGLTVREVIGLVQSAPGPLVGADVVELNPARDTQGLTAAVAAKLVKELAGRMLALGD
jgi:arginase